MLLLTPSVSGISTFPLSLLLPVSPESDAGVFSLSLPLGMLPATPHATLHHQVFTLLHQMICRPYQSQHHSYFVSLKRLRLKISSTKEIPESKKSNLVIS